MSPTPAHTQRDFTASAPTVTASNCPNASECPNGAEESFYVPSGIVIVIGIFLMFGFLLFLVLRAKYWPHYRSDIFPDLKARPRKPRPDLRRDAPHPTVIFERVGAGVGGSTTTSENVVGGAVKEVAAEVGGAIVLQKIQ